MAHSCPECDQVCHCGGDIDDVLIEDDDVLDACSHWEKCDAEEEYDDDFWDAPLRAWELMD